MKRLGNHTLRAVLAALLFFIASFALWRSGASPLNALKGVGDAYIVVDRPFDVESRLMDSALKRRLGATEGGASALALWGKWRETLGEGGAAMEWLGWSARVGLALRPKNSPVMAISPGLPVLMGGYLFKKAGFKQIEINGHRAYEKDGLFMAPINGTWVMGDRSGIEAVSGFKPGGSNLSKLENIRWKKLNQRLDRNASIAILVSPTGISRSLDYLSDNSTRTTLEEWTTYSSWDGMAWNVYVSGGGVSVNGRLMADNSPIPALMMHTDKIGNFSRWLPPDACEAAWIGAPRFINIWRQALYSYKDRPGPRDVLQRAETELDRELNIDIAKLAEHLRNDAGFVVFRLAGKRRTVLVAGIGSETDEFSSQIEKDISETQWKSTFITRKIRYLKRLMAYSVVDDHIVIASDPETLGAYFKEIKRRKDAPPTLLKLAADASDAPLALTGTLLDGANPSTGENSADNGNLWYSLTFKESGDVGVGLEIPGKLNKTRKPSWKTRLLIWVLASVEMLLYLLLAGSLIILVLWATAVARASYHGELADPDG